MTKKNNGRFNLILFAFLVLLMVFLPVLPVSAENGVSFDTKEMNIEMRVNRDYTVDVKEHWKLDYLTDAHGFYRTIPVQGDINLRKNGKLLKQSVRESVENVKVPGYEAKTEKSGGGYMIKIGSPDKYVSGIKDYDIYYRLKISPSRFRDFTYLYQELKPKNWPTSIENFSFRVILPEEVSEKRINIYSGSKNSDGNELTEYKVYSKDGKTYIEGKSKGVLETGDVVTLFSFLPEGYFDRSMLTSFNIWSLVTAAFIFILTILLLILFGRDEPIVKTVEFYPPDGIDPVNMGFMLNGKIGKKELAAEILYLADKGYLKVEQLGKKSREFMLHKIERDTENLGEDAASIYRNLFSSGKGTFLLSEKNEQGMGYLYDSMITMEERKKMRSRRNRKSKKSIRIRLAVTVLTFILPVLLWTVLALRTEIPHMALEIFALVFILFVVSLIISRMIYRDRYIKGNGNMIKAVLLVLTAALSVFLYYKGLQSFTYLVSGAVLPVSVIVSLFAGSYIEKIESDEAGELGRIMGFAEFIKTAEADRINKLADENPSYFFNILPYAYILGISDKWVKNMSDAINRVPDWYVGEFDVFDCMMFVYMANSFERSIYMGEMNLARMKADEFIGSDNMGSSGGFGSGGFGGGGFGGGGGGGW